MIRCTDPFTQRTLSATLNAPQNAGLFNIIKRWMTLTNFDSPIVNQAQMDEANAKGQLIEPEFGPPDLDVNATTTHEVVMGISARDVDENGITKEIGFCAYRLSTTREFNGEDRVFWFNGAIINHGTVDKPKWSIHT